MRALRTLFWIVFLIFMLLYIAAIFLTRTIGHNPERSAAVERVASWSLLALRKPSASRAGSHVGPGRGMLAAAVLRGGSNRSKMQNNTEHVAATGHKN